MSKCSFCRNEPAENEHHKEGDMYFYMCDDCEKRYQEHPQLGPKFLECRCDPDNPKELDLSMGEAEIKAAMEIQDMGIENDNKIVQDRSGLNKETVAFIPQTDPEPTLQKIKDTIWKDSGYIPKDENDNTKTKRKKMFKL